MRTKKTPLFASFVFFLVFFVFVFARGRADVRCASPGVVGVRETSFALLVRDADAKEMDRYENAYESDDFFDVSFSRNALLSTTTTIAIAIAIVT